jgi:hypothetical protein
MKIPVYTAQVGPEATTLPMPSAQALMEPARALTRAARDIGVSVSEWAQAEQALQNERDKNEAEALRFDALTGMEDRERRLKIGVKDEFGAVVEAPATAGEYLPAWKQAWRETADDTLGRASNPRVRMKLQRDLAREGVQLYRQANTEYLTRARGEDKAQALQLHDQYVKEAGLETDPGRREQILQRHDVYLDDKTVSLGADEVTRLKLKAREDVNVFDARREIQAGTYDPTKYAGKIGLQTYQTLNNQWQQETEQRDARKKAEWNEQKQQALGGLTLQAQQGAITKADLPRLQEAWKLNDHEVRALSADIDKAEDGQDDQPTVEYWTTEARNPMNDYGTIERLKSAFRQKKLKVNTYRAFEADILGTINRREQEQERDRLRAERERDRATAKAEAGARRGEAAMERAEQRLEAKRGRDLAITLDMLNDDLSVPRGAETIPGYSQSVEQQRNIAKRGLYSAMNQDPSLDPTVWWNANRVNYLRQNQAVVSQQLDVINKALPVVVGVDRNMYARAKADLDALRQKRQITEQEYWGYVEQIRAADVLRRATFPDLYREPTPGAQPAAAPGMVSPPAPSGRPAQAVTRPTGPRPAGAPPPQPVPRGPVRVGPGAAEAARLPLPTEPVRVGPIEGLTR